MQPLPSELLLIIFSHLDYKSLSRVSCVCKSWASLGREVFIRKGPPYQWLNVGSNIQHSFRVRRIFIRTLKDCGRRLSLSKVHDITIALSLVTNDGYWAPLGIMGFVGSPVPISLTIYDDCAASDSNLSVVRPTQMRRLHPQALFLIAIDARLSRLVVETLLVPNSSPLDDIPHGQRVAFPRLRTLRTRITVDMAPKMLAWMPQLEELALDVVDSDTEGQVARAAATLLPSLSKLKLSFWRRAVLDDQALEHLGKLSLLRLLDIRHNPVSAMLTTSLVNPQPWRAFIAGLPRLEHLRLPATVEVPGTDLLRLVGRSCPNMRRLHVNGLVDIGDLASSGESPLFPKLHALVVGSLWPEKKTMWVNRHMSRGVARTREDKLI
jgi:hypothetical protein